MDRARALGQSYRFRLVLAFSLVVAVALALVLTSLPRLLDGYFAQQEREALEDRAQLVTSLVVQQLIQHQALTSETVRPIVWETATPVASDMVWRALGDAEAGYVVNLARELARADVTMVLAFGPDRPDLVVYRLDVPLDPTTVPPGEGREPIEASRSAEILDIYWTRSEAAAPARLVTVTLSDPLSLRAQTLETIVGVLFGAAVLALLVAVVLAIVLAERLTNPIRRLTQASRSLAEGRLDERVSLPSRGSPEIAELATAFNAMAERLQASIEYISRDRDRSREFLADVSHELRTPIAALRTFNELLREGAADDAAARDEFLAHSHQQIERLDWLATNLLELSKLDSGLVALDLRPDDLRAVLEDAVAHVEPGATRKGVALHMQIPDTPVRALHDPPRLGQVLANVIGNAVKFTPPDGRVTVSLRSDADEALIEVADTGVGIDPAELPRVFERFYRGAQAVEERAAGSGLGLSIVHSVVEMHHGRVSIQSAKGTGTTVTVVLPRNGVAPVPAPSGVSVSSPPDSRS
ncbi:MAG: HAMP domain-containing histidine kinase [Chloroflexota bacterium]|nr:HAMP domain-containing histidine kinase [Chloroflexota bacterium]